MSNLENQIKQLIIDSLGLEDITVADIGSEDPLFGDDGLGLDSVDALELGLAVQKTFGFQLDGENDNLREKLRQPSKHWQNSSKAVRHKGEAI